MKKLFTLSLVLFCVQFSFAQQDICDLTVNYTGTYEDFILPLGISDITFTAKGGDGGYGRIATYLCLWDDYYVNDCKGNGGRGATVTATFSIGLGVDQLQPGGTIRTIVGGAGQSRRRPRRS